MRGESHIDFRTHYVIMTQRTWPPPPAVCVISRFWLKSIVFKIKKNLFRIKKGKLHLWRTTLYLIILLVRFIPLLRWITTTIWIKLKKLCIWTTKSCATQHQNHTSCTWIFLSNCNKVSDILDWTWFLHYFWLQEFIQQQT